MDLPKKEMKTSRLARVRAWYAKIEGPFSSISLVGGFVFDAVTLTRVDMFWENFWVVAHLLIVTTCIILINIQENETVSKTESAGNPEKIHFWLVNILQFFFGGILSTYLVFYFRSGTLWVSWPFLLILAAAFVANERLKRHYTRLTFQISLLFLSFYAFAIYLVPVIAHEIGPREFIVSGLVSLGLIAIFLLVLGATAKEKYKLRSKLWIASVILGILVVVNALYFFNFIPPIPLSLKDNGVYHSLTVNAPGIYTVTDEAHGPYDFFQLYPDVHLMPGDPLYAYSAIFSPGSFNLAVTHEWQYYDESLGAWVTRGRITLPVMGGRDGGYRTYSEEVGLASGKWRINVLTSRGQVIGRIMFNVVLGDSELPLHTIKIN